MATYTVNDSDVLTYLNQLNLKSITIVNTTDTGSQNLKKILNIVKPELKEVRYQQQEKLNHLIQRRLIVNNMINSLESSKYDNDDLETRYTTYKKHVVELINVKSPYMSIIQETIDTDLDAGMAQLSEYRRELIGIDMILDGLQEQIDYLKNLDNDITTLISKIDSL